MKTYPEPVEIFAEKVYHCFEEAIQQEFSDATPGWLKETSLKIISDVGVEKFIKGEELVFKDDQEVTELYIRLRCEIAISSLVKKGLVDTMENENGEEEVFLTEKGKAHGKLLHDKK